MICLQRFVEKAFGCFDVSRTRITKSPAYFPLSLQLDTDISNCP